MAGLDVYAGRSDVHTIYATLSYDVEATNDDKMFPGGG